MAGKHRAAILSQKGGPLSIADRTTPEPGPNEVLIEVKAVALNPVDFYQVSYGMPPVPSYPAVVGSDVAGLVSKVGSKVSNAPPLGSRAIAFTSFFFQNGSPDHGAFQKFTLAQSEGVIPLPDAYSFEEGALLPLAALTAMSSWYTMGIPLDTKYTTQDKQAILIWGGSSSVGTLTIQSAKSLGFTVYTTSSPQHHQYLEKLGADAVFDYKASDVVSQIVDAAKKDGVTLCTANCIVENSLQPTLDILKATKGTGSAKVAHAPVLPEDHPTLDNTEIKFTFPPLEPTEKDQHIYKTFHGWLSPGLKSGTVVPSPHIQTVAGGLEGINKGLDTLKAGVSGTKIVVSV